jgi:hypothetical protein
MKTPTKAIAEMLLLFLAAAITGNAQFKAVGPPPYTPAVARQKIKALVAKLDPADRQQSVTAISGLLGWYRDIADDELIAAWKKDDTRANLPDVITTLADAPVALGVVEFSWRQQRQATFNLAYAPMLGNLMLRFPESAKPFLDDLLGTGGASAPPLDLSEQEAYAVCKILLDMPDIRNWRMIGLQILPHYREIAENLLAADVNEGDRDTRNRALRWSADIKSSAPAPANAPTGRRIMQPPASLPAPRPSAEAKSGTLECSGEPIPPNAEYTFPNVPTLNRRFDYDRKVWDVRLTLGEGQTQNLILKNKSSRPQKSCVVRWTVTP